jgi:hypothetical protein
MDTREDKTTQERVMDFMLAEYTTLLQFRQDLLRLGENRLNFFLAAVSGAVVGLALLSTMEDHEVIVVSVSGIIIVGLLLVGWVTFARMVERSAGVVRYTKGMNCIRGWFSDQIPDIKKCLVLPSSADQPPFSATGFLSKGSSSLGLWEAVAVINCIVAGAGASILCTIWTSQTGLVISCGGAVFAIFLFVQIIYYHCRIRQIQEKWEAEFATCE